jgi:hypothetical protein
MSINFPASLNAILAAHLGVRWEVKQPSGLAENEIFILALAYSAWACFRTGMSGGRRPSRARKFYTRPGV